MSARNGGDAEPGLQYRSLFLPMRLHSLQRRTFSSVCLRPASKGSRRVPRLLRTKKWNVCNRRHCGSGKEVQPQLSAPQTSPQRLDSRDSTRAPDQNWKDVQPQDAGCKMHRSEIPREQAFLVFPRWRAFPYARIGAKHGSAPKKL